MPGHRASSRAAHTGHHPAPRSEDELFQQATERINRLKSYGTGALEIKSGYGLTVDAELKMLRVIKRLKKECD